MIWCQKNGQNNQSQNISMFGGCPKLGNVSKSVKFVNFEKVSNFEHLPNVLTLSLFIKVRCVLKTSCNGLLIGVQQQISTVLLDCVLKAYSWYVLPFRAGPEVGEVGTQSWENLQAPQVRLRTYQKFSRNPMTKWINISWIFSKTAIFMMNKRCYSVLKNYSLKLQYKVFMWGVLANFSNTINEQIIIWISRKMKIDYFEIFLNWNLVKIIH